MPQERQTSPYPKQEERAAENKLRPLSFDDYIGQRQVVENLRVFIEAARQRGEALDHILFCGPPGLGKTTLAHVIAKEMKGQLRTTSGPSLERHGDLAALLTNVEQRGVMFIDEIHRLHHTVEEALYPALEDFKLDIIVGEGPNARSLALPLQPFTLIGATTRAGLLTSPLRDRFGMILHLDFYSHAELGQIIDRSARILKVDVEQDASIEIARRSRGTPRIANRLLRRVRDFAQIEKRKRIDIATASQALLRLEVDEEGFDKMDRKILLAIIDKFDGGPVGLDTISQIIGEERDTIEEVYEPFLVQRGFVQRTSRGRVATERAHKHLNKAFNPAGQAKLL